jgi:hypothetical protein
MHYTDIFNAIAAHIKTAWDVETTSAGRAAKNLAQLPRAVITLESCDRTAAGRSIEQQWTWTVAGEFALPVGSTDAQKLMAEKAEALIDLLTPFSESSGSVPAAAAAFGGIGYQPMVPNWSPIPLDDADNSCGVTMTFTVNTTVWQ